MDFAARAWSSPCSPKLFQSRLQSLLESQELQQERGIKVRGSLSIKKRLKKTLKDILLDKKRCEKSQLHLADTALSSPALFDPGTGEKRPCHGRLVALDDLQVLLSL